MPKKESDPICGAVESAAWSSTPRIKVTTHTPKINHENQNASSGDITNLSQPVRTSSGYSNCQPNWSVPGASKILKCKLCGSDPKAPSFPNADEVARKLPSVQKVDLEAISRFGPFSAEGGRGDTTLGATWMSHSAFIVTAGGYTVLTDPVWSYRASPVQFAGPARMLPPPIPLGDLPYIDVVTISHNHYDHLDTASVKHLITLNHRQAAARASVSSGTGKGASSSGYLSTHPVFVVPMGMKQRWFAPLAKSLPQLDLDKVVELMWWDTASVAEAVAHNRSLITTPANSALENKEVFHRLPPFSITAVPVQHWSQRSGWDRNQELWCGFVYTVGDRGKTEEGEKTAKEDKKENDNKTSSSKQEEHTEAVASFRFFHSGDTGYFKKIFEEIGNEFGPFDFSMIPIGAYEPRSVMANQHVDPFEAVEIHKDLKSLNSAGMHWGTFILTDEPIDEPPKALAVAMAEANGTIPKTQGADDDANAERLKLLRRDHFLSPLSSTSLPLGHESSKPTATLAPFLVSDGDVIPYTRCDKPFRALRHGETWFITNSKKEEQ